MTTVSINELPVLTTVDSVNDLMLVYDTSAGATKACAPNILTGSHTHVISDITGLQTALDAKIESSTISTFGATLIDDVDAAAARTTLGLGTAATSASSAFQPVDAELTAIAGLTSAANNLPYFTGSGTAALAPISAGGRALINTTAAANVIPYYTSTTAATTTALSAGGRALINTTAATDALPYYTSTTVAATTTLTAFARTLLDDVDAAAARTTLGIAASTQPAIFRVTNSATQSLPAGTVTKLTFNTETVDSDNFYDNATNYRFTPTVAGWYQITINADVNQNAVANVNNVRIHKNGTLYSYSTGAFPQIGATWCITDLVQFNGSTDYIEAFYYNSGVGAATLTTQSSFSGRFVRT